MLWIQKALLCILNKNQVIFFLNVTQIWIIYINLRVQNVIFLMFYITALCKTCLNKSISDFYKTSELFTLYYNLGPFVKYTTTLTSKIKYIYIQSCFKLKLGENNFLETGLKSILITHGFRVCKFTYLIKLMGNLRINICNTFMVIYKQISIEGKTLRRSLY